MIKVKVNHPYAFRSYFQYVAKKMTPENQQRESYV